MECIAAVVVLYNPDYVQLKSNIESYIDEVDRLYIIDNSEINGMIPVPTSKEKKCVYVKYRENRGIATALNEAAKRAISDGYTWLLTMDQDSCCNPGMIQGMLNFIEEMPVENVAIVAACPDISIGKRKTEKDWCLRETVITSGNLVNLSAYMCVGGYENKLFIDYVDYVFCLELRRYGYRIVQLNKLKFSHTLGCSQVKTIGWIKIIPSFHNALRRYYIMRNRSYMYRKYFKFFPLYILEDFFLSIKELVKLLLFEDDKKKKVMYMCKGFIDFWKDAWGPYISS